MSRANNVVVAQSGGPTPVINASLRGVVDGCRAYPGEFGTVYALSLIHISEPTIQRLVSRMPSSA